MWNTSHPSIIPHLHAYGHTEEKKHENGTFSFDCQHGPLECRLNIIETCVDHLYHNQSVEFVYCVAGNVSVRGAERLVAYISRIYTEDLFDCVNNEAFKSVDIV